MFLRIQCSFPLLDYVPKQMSKTGRNSWLSDSETSSIGRGWMIPDTCRPVSSITSHLIASCSVASPLSMYPLGPLSQYPGLAVLWGTLEKKDTGLNEIIHSVGALWVRRRSRHLPWYYRFGHGRRIDLMSLRYRTKIDLPRNRCQNAVVVYLTSEKHHLLLPKGGSWKVLLRCRSILVYDADQGCSIWISNTKRIPQDS